MARTRGCIWLAAGVIVALLAGLVAFITLSRTATARQEVGAPELQGPNVKVVVVSQAVPIRTVLTSDVLTIKELPVDAAPAGYLSEIEQATGKLSVTELVQGEAVISSRLVEPDVVAPNGRLALVVNDDQVLMAFPASDLLSKVNMLKAGDHVDVLVSLPIPISKISGDSGPDQQATVNLLPDAVIAGVVAPEVADNTVAEPQALLLTVNPQDALILKYARDRGGVFDIVLRAPGAEQPFDVDPVDADYFINKYQIPIAVGR